MVKLAIAAPLGERCGIADYARQLSEALPGGFDIHWIGLPAGASARTYRQAADRANEADLAHVHYEYGLFAPVKPYRNRFTEFMKRLRLPVIVTLHDRLPQIEPRWRKYAPYRARDLARDVAYLPLFRSWERNQYMRVSRWIVHEGQTMDHVVRLAGPEHVSFLHHPVPASTRSWCVENAQKNLLVTPGFVKVHKGYERIIPILETRPDWKWVIAGGPQNHRDETYLNKLKEMIHRIGIQRQVEITGYLSREHMEEKIARGRLAVLPFHHTSGSGSITWAVAVNIPIIATDLPATRSMKESSIGMVLLPHHEGNEWTEAIGRLLDNSERLQSISRKNKSYAERYSYSSAAEQMADLFQTLM